MIKHFPITNTDIVVDHYSKKDGVDVKYVCTTELDYAGNPIDIFYRATPHPKFGNRYFGIYIRPSDDSVMICNADKVETLTFGMVKDDDGDLQYSNYHHDYKSFKNGNMIDGGRLYIRSSLGADVYVVRDGNMIAMEGSDE